MAFCEPETQSDQQRLTSIVTVQDTLGYYVDIFRSRRRDGRDKMHDYFYHNLGQEMTLAAADGSDALVRAGSLENPSVTPVVINLRADSEAMKRLDGFRLDIVGTSSAETAGIALNSNQYIQITDISVSVDCGVETQF